MKYLKKFNEMLSPDFAEDIATDLLTRFQERRNEGDVITLKDFDEYMLQRGANSDLADSVMHYLVSMGFDFDIEDDEGEDIDFETKGF